MHINKIVNHLWCPITHTAVCPQSKTPESEAAWVPSVSKEDDDKEEDNQAPPVFGPELERSESVRANFDQHCVCCNSEPSVSDQAAWVIHG